MELILASQSSGRLAMLRAAGLAVTAVSPGVDEDVLKQGFRAENLPARALADALAEAKALKISARHSDAMVLGADQILVLDDDTQLDKPETPQQAMAHLRAMSGSTHRLITAAVICEAGQPVWRHVELAKLTMRPLSEDFIHAYVTRLWDDIRHSVGCYRIEGEGAQLFTSIEGSQFNIVGLPLLALMDYLRIRGYLPT